jgi:hypothetical protein
MEISVQNNAVGLFVSTLMSSRTQAHIFHLQTPSDSAHRALGKYYENIIDLVDTFTESYQGKYGVIKGYSQVDLQEYQSCEAIILYFTALSVFINRARPQLPQDAYLQSQIDLIEELIFSTTYKLKHLK